MNLKSVHSDSKFHTPSNTPHTSRSPVSLFTHGIIKWFLVDKQIFTLSNNILSDFIGDIDFVIHNAPFDVFF